MDFTCELCKSFKLSPFELLKQDKDEVIMWINYFVEKGETETEENVKNQPSCKNDGFWDF